MQWSPPFVAFGLLRQTVNQGMNKKVKYQIVMNAKKVIKVTEQKI